MVSVGRENAIDLCENDTELNAGNRSEPISVSRKRHSISNHDSEISSKRQKIVSSSPISPKQTHSARNGCFPTKTQNVSAKNALSSSKNRNIQTPVRPRRRTHVDSSPEIECIDLSFSQESLKNYGEIDKVELKSPSFPAKIDISQSQEIQGPSPPPPVLVSRSKSNVPRNKSRSVSSNEPMSSGNVHKPSSAPVHRQIPSPASNINTKESLPASTENPAVSGDENDFETPKAQKPKKTKRKKKKRDPKPSSNPQPTQSPVSPPPSIHDKKYACFMCDKSLSRCQLKGRLKHLKRCADERGVDSNTLVARVCSKEIQKDITKERKLKRVSKHAPSVLVSEMRAELSKIDTEIEELRARRSVVTARLQRALALQSAKDERKEDSESIRSSPSTLLSMSISPGSVSKDAETSPSVSEWSKNANNIADSMFTQQERKVVPPASSGTRSILVPRELKAGSSVSATQVTSAIDAAAGKGPFSVASPKQSKLSVMSASLASGNKSSSIFELSRGKKSSKLSGNNAESSTSPSVSSSNEKTVSLTQLVIEMSDEEDTPPGPGDVSQNMIQSSSESDPQILSEKPTSSNSRQRVSPAKPPKIDKSEPITNSNQLQAPSDVPNPTDSDIQHSNGVPVKQVATPTVSSRQVSTPVQSPKHATAIDVSLRSTPAWSPPPLQCSFSESPVDVEVSPEFRRNLFRSLNGSSPINESETSTNSQLKRTAISNSTSRDSKRSSSSSQLDTAKSHDQVLLSSDSDSSESELDENPSSALPPQPAKPPRFSSQPNAVPSTSSREFRSLTQPNSENVSSRDDSLFSPLPQLPPSPDNESNSIVTPQSKRPALATSSAFHPERSKVVSEIKNLDLTKLKRRCSSQGFKPAGRQEMIERLIMAWDSRHPHPEYTPHRWGLAPPGARTALSESRSAMKKHRKAAREKRVLEKGVSSTQPSKPPRKPPSKKPPKPTKTHISTKPSNHPIPFPLRISLSQPVPDISQKESRKSIFKPLRASTLSDLSSENDSGSDSTSGSDSGSESEDEFESVDEKKCENGKKRKRLSTEEAEEFMLKMFRDDSELYQKILLFEAIDLSEFTKRIDAANVLIPKPKLMKFLDKQGVSYAMKWNSDFG
eukprot:855536_1